MAWLQEYKRSTCAYLGGQTPPARPKYLSLCGCASFSLFIFRPPLSVASAARCCAYTTQYTRLRLLPLVSNTGWIDNRLGMGRGPLWVWMGSRGWLLVAPCWDDASLASSQMHGLLWPMGREADQSVSSVDASHRPGISTCDE